MNGVVVVGTSEVGYVPITIGRSGDGDRHVDVITAKASESIVSILAALVKV